MKIDANTRALVTGASRGIGRSIAFALAARGATVGLLARDSKALDALAAELPGSHHALPADVTSRREVERAVAQMVDDAGGLDLAVANAGIAHYGPFPDMEIELVEQMVSINLLGSLYTVRAALDHMLGRGRGHLVVVSSGAGLRAFPDGAVYGATKAANRAFAEALRHELSGTGVSLTTVFPGEVETHLHDHQPEKIPDWRRGDEAIDPDELAAAVVAAIEADDRAVFAPRLVRLLGVNGVAPRLLDRLLRQIRGPAAAPRLD